MLDFHSWYQIKIKANYEVEQQKNYALLRAYLNPVKTHMWYIYYINGLYSRQHFARHIKYMANHYVVTFSTLQCNGRQKKAREFNWSREWTAKEGKSTKANIHRSNKWIVSTAAMPPSNAIHHMDLASPTWPPCDGEKGRPPRVRMRFRRIKSGSGWMSKKIQNAG